MLKVIAHDVTGLYELAELQEISEQTIREFLTFANDPGLARDFLIETVQVLWVQLRGTKEKLA